MWGHKKVFNADSGAWVTVCKELPMKCILDEVYANQAFMRRMFQSLKNDTLLAQLFNAA